MVWFYEFYILRGYILNTAYVRWWWYCVKSVVLSAAYVIIFAALSERRSNAIIIAQNMVHTSRYHTRRQSVLVYTTWWPIRQRTILFHILCFGQIRVRIENREHVFSWVFIIVSFNFAPLLFAFILFAVALLRFYEDRSTDNFISVVSFFFYDGKEVVPTLNASWEGQVGLPRRGTL